MVRTVIAVLALVATLAASLVVVRVVIYSPESAAESTVAEFLRALADRDLEGVLATVAPEAVDDAVDQLGGDPSLIGSLWDDAYRPARSAEIEQVTVDGRSAVAEVTYFAGTDSHTASLQLRRDRGFVDAVVTPRWRVLNAFGTLDLGEVREALRVGGLPVPGPDSDGRRRVPALPGSYELTVVNQPNFKVS